nr:hypothetical protein [Tanacetum cinerariifolium]
MLIPYYQDFKNQDFRYSDRFECFQAIIIGRYLWCGGPFNSGNCQRYINTTSPPILPIKDLEDSLIMGNEELNTIPKKELDEVIKSSVEDFVPILNEFDDTSESDKDIECKASYDSNLDEPALLVTPLFDSNKDECFDPGGDVDEINAFYIPSDFEDGCYDLEGDVLYLESLLSDDTTPNLPLEVFLDRDPRRLMDSSLSLSSESEDIIFDPNIFAFSFYSLESVASHRSGTFMCFNVYPNILNESLMGFALPLVSILISR